MLGISHPSARSCRCRMVTHSPECTPPRSRRRERVRGLWGRRRVEGGEAKVAGEGEKRKRGERGGRRVKEQKQKDELQQVATASSGSGGEGNGGGGRGTTAHYMQLNSHILDCGSTGELCELIEAHAEEFDAVNVATAFRKLLQSRRDGVPRGFVERALQALEAAALRRMDAFKGREVANILHIMAKTRYRPSDPALVQKLEGRAEALAGTFNVQNVANTLWAYATMGREPGAGVMRGLDGAGGGAGGHVHRAGSGTTFSRGNSAGKASEALGRGFASFQISTRPRAWAGPAGPARNTRESVVGHFCGRESNCQIPYSWCWFACRGKDDVSIVFRNFVACVDL